MLEIFSLKKDSKVFIYGAGALGRRIRSYIGDYYHFEGYIDQKKDSINLAGCGDLVYGLEDLNILSKDICVIVCVHNGLWHRNICDELYNRGVDNILFLAVGDTFDYSQSQQMNEKYSIFMSQTFDISDIPKYGSMCKQKNVDDYPILYQSGDFVTLLYPIELLYSDNANLEEAHNFRKITDQHRKYVDKPMTSHAPYLDLFRYMMFGGDYPAAFIELYRNMNNSTHMTDEEFLDSKWKIYNLLEKEYLKGWGYLKYSPIYASWNENGYANIRDGHHRAAFYYLKGMRRIPVRLSKEDYVKFQSISYKPFFAEGAISTWDIISSFLVSEQRVFPIVLDATNRNHEIGAHLIRIRATKSIMYLDGEVIDSKYTDLKYDLAIYEDRTYANIINAQEVIFVSRDADSFIVLMNEYGYRLEKILGNVCIEGIRKTIALFKKYKEL